MNLYILIYRVNSTEYQYIVRNCEYRFIVNGVNRYANFLCVELTWLHL